MKNQFPQKQPWVVSRDMELVARKGMPRTWGLLFPLSIFSGTALGFACARRDFADLY